MGVGLFLWINRERPSSGDTHSATPRPAPAQTFASAEARFDEARKQFADGRFSESAKVFRALYEEGGLHEPKNSWAAVHLGLAEYFAGHPESARAAFDKLAERIVPSTIGLDAGLVAFLNRLAEIGSGKAKLTLTLAWMEEFDTTSYLRLAYLCGAAREWEAGAFGDAAELFRQFQQTIPSGDSAWVADYRHLVARYLADYGIYREIADAIRNVETAPDAAEAALKRLPEEKNRLRSPGLRQKLTELEADSAGKVAAAVAATARKQAEAGALEERLLTSAKLAAKSLCENYSFAEAAAAIRAADVRRERAVAERELLAKRIDWLAQFKSQLIEDLNTGACTLPLQRKNGQRIPGEIARATDAQLDVRVQFGSLPVAWSDLSAQSVLQMARFHMKPALAASALADRQWLAGVFCLFAQLSSEGWALMDQAAAKKDDYRTQAALFFGHAAPAAPPPQPPSSDAPPATSDPGTGLETIDQPLNPSRRDSNTELIKGLRRPNAP